MKYLFRGGTVVSGRGTRRADVLVEDEKILRVARSITALFRLLLIFCDPSRPRMMGARLRSGCGSGKTGLLAANFSLNRRAITLVSSR